VTERACKAGALPAELHAHRGCRLNFKAFPREPKLFLRSRVELAQQKYQPPSAPKPPFHAPSAPYPQPGSQHCRKARAWKTLNEIVGNKVRHSPVYTDGDARRNLAIRHFKRKPTKMKSHSYIAGLSSAAVTASRTIPANLSTAAAEDRSSQQAAGR
jgi:hypothetical protein